MRELFFHYNFSPDERNILNYANSYLSKASNYTPKYTLNQLRYQLIGSQVIDSSFSQHDYTRLITRGLLAGKLDWESFNVEHPVINNFVGKELWIRGTGLRDWLSNNLRGSMARVFHTSKLYWDIITLKHSLDLNRTRAFPTNIYYLSDYYTHSDTTYERFKELLTRMYVIVEARSIFNLKLVKENLWLLEGIKRSHRKDSTIKRYVQLAVAQAKPKVNAYLKFHNLGMQPNSPYYKYSSSNKLESLPPEKLLEIIISLNKI